MENRKTGQIKKYYTWKGLGQWYDTVEEAQDKVNELKKKDVLPEHVFAAGFDYEEEAEAFSKGAWDKYIDENYKEFDASKYEAVIYVDGSFTPYNKHKASYGLIIFFCDEKPRIESGTIQDVEGEKKYEVVIYNEDGEIEKTETRQSGESDFVCRSQVAVGELFGAMRSLEICCKEKGKEKILLFYDRDGIEKGYNQRNDIRAAQGDAAVEYREFLQKEFLKDVKIEFAKVDSHGGGKKPQCKIDANKYLHAVYNDLVDILAKAENEIKIEQSQEFNVFRAIPDEFKGYYYAGAVTADKKRKHARKLVEDVLKQSGGIFKPKF